MFLRKIEYSDHRHETLLRHCVRIAEAVGGLPDAGDDRDAVEELVRRISREYDGEETNRDDWVALRISGKHTTEGDDPPTSL